MNRQSQKIKLIVSPRHTAPLFLNGEQIFVFSTHFSNSILESLESAFILKKDELKFNSLLEYLAKHSEQKVNNNVDNSFQAGLPAVYKRVEHVQNILEYSIRGDVITAWIMGYESPLRFSFFDQECEIIQKIDSVSGKAFQSINKVILFNIIPEQLNDVFEIKVFGDQNDTEILSKIIHVQILRSDPTAFYKNIEVIKTDIISPTLYFGSVKAVQKDISSYLEKGFKVLIQSENNLPEDLLNLRLGADFQSKIEFLNYSAEINAEILEKLPSGFISKSNKIAFLTDRELFSSLNIKRSVQLNSSSRLKDILRNFEGNVNVGDFVVHEDYGISIYKGIKQESIDEVIRDYVLLEFANADEIYVPLEEMRKVTKYFGNESNPPALSSLTKSQWKKVKEKVQKQLLTTAKELVAHYAKRELSTAISVNKKDGEIMNVIEKSFPYTLTNDQKAAIEEVFLDLQQTKPMDRLLIGDVGFGKTEVILRASGKIVEAGLQVAFLCPTTILAAQHYEVFKERFEGTNVKIAHVSRFSSKNDNSKFIDLVNEGKVDIIIGTHRLLSSDVKFNNLGLIVVDEEQKFGVKQKEKLKRLNYSSHVLSVSATPIPRSLNLALSSIQDISIITTPPPGRKPVKTEIIYNEWNKAVSAIQNELRRNGQAYFIHNRVSTIQTIYNKLIEYMPDLRIGIAHGRLSSSELDKTITSFYEQKYDVLLSTNIIENGLDIPNVNTIIIHNSHHFGLAQIYQMRGRVGRSTRKAYCYLMMNKPKSNSLDNIKEDVLSLKKKQNNNLAVQRLETIVNNQDLGAGFKIASKDLELRGAGSILGEQQSGHINYIGYALYIEMLAKEIELLKSEVLV